MQGVQLTDTLQWIWALWCCWVLWNNMCINSIPTCLCIPDNEWPVSELSMLLPTVNIPACIHRNLVYDGREDAEPLIMYSCSDGISKELSQLSLNYAVHTTYRGLKLLIDHVGTILYWCRGKIILHLKMLVMLYHE